MYPVTDAGNSLKILVCNCDAIQRNTISKRYGGMLQDILPVIPDPRGDVLNNTILVPSPFLTTAATLATVLNMSTS
jgi:hypothetical protein